MTGSTFQIVQYGLLSALNNRYSSIMNSVQSRFPSPSSWWVVLIIVSFLMRITTLGFGNLFVEEAYYWNYAEHLDWGYLDHPPMVAWLIKLFTTCFANSEWFVRLPALFCWVIASFYSFRLTELICKQGWAAVFFMSILPFFFCQSWVMTPDQPLIAAWSATLYYLYRACVLNQARAWYYAGIALGLGLLSKYTIALLIPSVGIYLLIAKDKYRWFFKKEPYLALCIALFLFSPVIYWNATHDWASFIFQTSRRLQDSVRFSTHHLLGILLLFLMPYGVAGLWTLLKSPKQVLHNDSLLLLQTLVFGPLFIFLLFSTMHRIKLNWIGPIVLSLIPWLVMELKNHTKAWLVTACFLLAGYSGMLYIFITKTPATLYHMAFNEASNWKTFSAHVLQEARNIETTSHIKPMIVGLDQYHIASEVAFYQAKYPQPETYQILGRDLFDMDSLMYRFWRKDIPIGQSLLLIADKREYFANSNILNNSIAESPVLSWNVEGSGQHRNMKQYFYQRVKWIKDISQDR